MIDTIRVRDDDDTGDDGPIYAPLTGEVSEEYAQGMIDPRDWMAEIRARQAIYQNLKRGWENQHPHQHPTRHSNADKSPAGRRAFA